MNAPPAGRDTIFAVSSGPPPAAIAVMRVSGPAAGAALHALAGRLPAPRRASLARLRAADGGLLDEALILWFPGPASATGEDLAELHLHGGRATVAAVSDALAARPALRPAEPGEFTRRAFLNGRVDLAQAEGLADLLAAETEAQRRHALMVAEGGLSRLFETWRVAVLALAARAEAQIEFGEDEDDVGGDAAIGDDADALAEQIGAVLAHPPAERLRDGIRIVVAGPPNAGKSTLINALSGRDAAIVSERPGTTRDLIEVPVSLGGWPCVLIDSAGLRKAFDPVERIGIDRARQVIATADMLLWLGSPAECPSSACRIIIHPRADEPDRTDCPAGVDLALSARSGLGMKQLCGLLATCIADLQPRPETPAMHARQRRSITECCAALRDAALQQDLVLQAEHFRKACVEIDRLTGRAGIENMLDGLFARFCIGK